MTGRVKVAGLPHTWAIMQNGVPTEIETLNPMTGAIEKHPWTQKGKTFKTAADADAYVASMGGTPSGKYPVDAEGNIHVTEIQKLPKLDAATAKQVAELNATGANIDPEGKSTAQVQALIAAELAKNNTLSDAQITHIGRVQDKYNEVPIVKNASNVLSGYENALSSLDLKSGIGDKTAIEEAQRILNPGQGVRAQTIKMFGASMGLLEKFDPQYIADHLKKGRLFDDQTEKEFRGIIQKAFQERVNQIDEAQKPFIQRATDGRIPTDKVARYITNPLKEAVTNTQPIGTPAQKATPSAPAVKMTFNGKQVMIPAANVEAAKARGAQLVQ
jgi:hypothetical protein